MTPTDEEFEQLRTKAVEDLVTSDLPKKLVVAGPGTGKTFAFLELLSRKAGNNLALTFITNLVAELAVMLNGIANVQTFHGYCKSFLYSVNPEGIGNSFDYYPPLESILADDLDLLDYPKTDTKAISSVLMNLNDKSDLLAPIIRGGDYYKAVGYTDSVYRAWRHLKANPRETPMFTQIVVDEYQDFSLLEVSFIAQLAERSPILVVGDDDQALYTFKHASEDYIRKLASDKSYSRFELPFCTRCTEVMVAAAHTLVEKARERSLLEGRIEKQYVSYPPAKRAASLKYPYLVHGDCTVQKKDLSYMGEYVAEQISKLPEEDIVTSREEGHPTVLVLGPKQFLDQVEPVLVDLFDDVMRKHRSEVEPEILDGYRRLSGDEESRLGWRIICYYDPPPEWPRPLRNALEENIGLDQLLGGEWKTKHLRCVRLIRRLTKRETLDKAQIEYLESMVGMTIDDLGTELGIQQEGEKEEVRADQEDREISGQPSILLTNITGSKGLQAEHVFILGLNEGHFPKSNRHVKNIEVCQLLVALTRGRQSCHLLSCDMYAGKFVQKSVFLDWLNEHLSHVKIDKNYVKALAVK